MSASYSLWLATPAGLRLLPLDGFISLDYARQVNAHSPLTLVMPGDAGLWKYLQRDNRIEVWRSVDGGPELLDTETVWFIRRRKKLLPQRGERQIEVGAYSANELLDRRIIAYAAGTTQASKSQALDDMAKAIVRENLGALASDATRAISSYLSVEADRSAAPTDSKGFPWEYVLPNLQQLAQTSAQLGTNLFFDIVAPTSAALEFRTYLNQRGSDHRASSAYPVVVGPDDGSLVDVELSEDWSDERTFVYAGGQGDGSSRMIATASDSGRAGASPLNRREVFVNATRYTSLIGVQSDANARLAEGKPRTVLTGRLVETPSRRYGVHWRWGDGLTAVVDSEPFDVRVDTVRVRVAKGTEDIQTYLRGER